MRLQPDLTMFTVDNDTLVFSDAAQRLIGLNASADFVFRELQDGQTKDRIAEALVTKGLASSIEASSWVETTLELLGQNGMLANAPHLVRKKEIAHPILN